MKNKVDMKCPSCGEKGKKQFKSRVCISESKELKEAIIKAENFKWECPKCKKHFFIKSPFLYNDDENGFMVYLIPEYNKMSHKVPTVIKVDDKYDTNGSVLRIAISFVEFLEKIRILESKLDDRLIEVIKLLYADMYVKNSGEKVFNIVFEKFDEDGNLHVSVYLENKDFEAVIPKSIYEQAKADFSHLFEDAPKDEFIVVNQAWLSDILSKGK